MQLQHTLSTRSVNNTYYLHMPQVTQLSYLTAELHVVLLFTMAHALGYRASALPEPTRVWVLTAISALQLVCFVTRGKRPFTEAEHNYVYEVIGKQFWNSLARIVEWKETDKAKATAKWNEGRSPSKRKRVSVFKPRPPCSDESSDTVDSDGNDSRVPKNFSHSEKIVPHAFVHLAEQVVLGGTHQFHNTSATESCHKSVSICLKIASANIPRSMKPKIPCCSTLWTTNCSTKLQLKSSCKVLPLRLNDVS